MVGGSLIIFFLATVTISLWKSDNPLSLASPLSQVATTISDLQINAGWNAWLFKHVSS